MDDVTSFIPEISWINLAPVAAFTQAHPALQFVHCAAMPVRAADTRQMLYTGRTLVKAGRGGAELPLADRCKMWPDHLDKKLAAARPTLTLPDVEAMLESESSSASSRTIDPP